jgi:hypothetical protein
MQLGHKVCTVCSAEKPVAAFPSRRGATCQVCHGKLSRERHGRSPEAWCAYIAGQARSNAKKTDREFDITAEQVYELWQQQHGLCALTNIPMQHHPAYSDMNASIDRIEGSIGYLIDNVQLVCWRINEMKNDQPEHQLFWWARLLVANDKKH